MSRNALSLAPASAGANDEGGRIAGGGGEFLYKPCQMKTLSSRIRKILDETVD